MYIQFCSSTPYTYSVRDNGIIGKLAAYVILGISCGCLPAAGRRVIYTTNAIEKMSAAYRKLNRRRSVFPSSQAFLKALYPAAFEAAKKWTAPLRNRGQAYGELTIMYKDRLPD